MESRLLRQLHHEWGEANAYYLKNALIRPMIELSAGLSRLGAWTADTRTISLSRKLVFECPWPQVNEVLRHEMAHQFVSEVLRVDDERAHGEAYRQAAVRLGVDPVAAGLACLDQPEAAVHRKIRKLLNLATSSNRHEAEAATTRAQRLMLKHNLGQLDEPVYTARVIGPTKRRFQRWQKQTMALLSTHFFIDVMWVPMYDRDRDVQGRAAECMGTPANLDVAAYVYDFLCRTAERLWRDWSQDRTGQRTDRQQFLNGVISGFGAKLREQRARNEQTGLVWVADPGLLNHVHKRYPRTRRTKGASLAATGAYAAGNVAGRGIVLSQGVTATGQRGRLIEG